VEDIRNTGFANLATYPNTFTPTGLPSGSTGTVSLTNNIDGATEANIYRADVTITWTFKSQHQIKTSTYITKGGIKR
jgi:hypothetical protein